MQPVSVAEIKRSFGQEREEWVMSAQEELTSYETNDTFDKLTEAEIAAVNKKDILPMKSVSGIKEAVASGIRRKKTRGVACGNFQRRSPEEEVYTENVEISTVRATVAIAARRGWDMGALDIKTAFLNAPLTLPEGKEVILRPPPLFVALGLCSPRELWRAKKAIYGLRVAPKAWGDKRDYELANVRFELDGVWYKLQRSNVDPQIWCIIAAKDPKLASSVEVKGFILTYVDDYLYTAERPFMKKIEEVVGKLWKLSLQPILEYGSSGELHYLGCVIAGRPDGYTMGQKQYTVDLIEKWGMTSASAVGTIDIEAFDEDAEVDEPQPADVKAAQKMSGGLLWLSGRTRPDLAFSVSRVASQSTTRPLWSLRLGKRIIRYLIGTKGHVLVFKGGYGKDGRCKEIIICYADASFEPTRAQSGFCIYYCHMLIDWKSIKQPQPARSTGEAELTVLAVSNLSLEGREALFHSLSIAVDSELRGDNEASIAMAHGMNSWRTRALCNRSAGLKARVADKTLKLTFVGTDDQYADGLTKFLSVPKMSKSRLVLNVMVA